MMAMIMYRVNRLIVCLFGKEHYKLYRSTPKNMYGTTLHKLIYGEHKRHVANHYFAYLSSINKYKPYFHHSSNDNFDIGLNDKELSPFLEDLVSTVHQVHTVHEHSVQWIQDGHGKYKKINLPTPTRDRLANGGKKWLSSLRQFSNQRFLNDLQFVALLWCFTPNKLQYSVTTAVYDELMKRYSAFDTQSCLKAASFLYILKANDSMKFNDLSRLWVLIVTKLHRNAHSLSNAEIVLTIFFAGLTRSIHLTNITNNLTNCLLKIVPYLSPNEVGVVAISNFLTINTASPKISFFFFEYFICNIDHMNEICFMSLCKFLKNAKPFLLEYELEHTYTFLLSFHNAISSFSSIGIIHGYLFLLTNGIFTTELLKFLQNFLLDSSKMTWRSKELSYFSGIIGKMYPLFPESYQMLSALFNELCEEKHWKEIKSYQYQLSLSLDCASRAGYYPSTLIRYVYGKEGYQYFKKHLLENYNQHKSIISRLELDQPELFKKIRPLSHNQEKTYLFPSRKTGSFFEEFIDVSTKVFRCKIAKTVHNFNSDGPDAELRIKDGQLFPVDKWHEMDRCIKVVLVYTLKSQYQSVIDNNFNIYHELIGIISCKLRLYEKSGYTVIVAKEERQISELPKYFNKLISDIKDICENSKNLDIAKIHIL